MNTEWKPLNAAFEKWWQEEGQYCRAGGSDYEKTFAYRAFDAALAGKSTVSVDRWKRDSELLEAIQDGCWDVRFLSSSNGDAGDYNIGIEIVAHFMEKPQERVIGEDWNENLRTALEQAMTAEAYPPARPAPTSHPIPTGATGKRDWELSCDECNGSGHVFVKHQVAERKTDVQEFKEECEACEGRGFNIAFEDIPGIAEYVKSCWPAPAAGDALDALRELVACDNIKKQIASMQECFVNTDEDFEEMDRIVSDLARRQPAAWEAARAAIAQQKGEA